MAYCKYCDRETPEKIVELNEGPHYAKVACVQCGHFLYWMKKPENEGKRTKSSKHTPDSLNKYFCEICGRDKSKLGKHETLEVHHKIPVEEGGPDTGDNILVLCTPCHKLCHFLRTYLHHHLNGFYSFQKENENERESDAQSRSVVSR